MEIDILEIILLLCVSAGSAFIQRVSGFGFGIFAMLFLPHFLPNHTMAAAISSALSGTMTIYNAAKYRKHIAYKTMLPMAVAALITIPIAVYFSAVVPGRIFKMILGIVLICLSNYFLFIARHLRIKATVKSGLIAGALGGTLNGLFSTGGPPAVVYLTHALTDNLSYFATIQFYFAVTNAYGTVIRIINGIFTLEVLLYVCIGFAGAMLGNRIGTRVFDKLNPERLKRVIYVGMIISGVLMIWT